MSVGTRNGARVSPRQRRVVAAQVHVSVALTLAAVLLWDAATRLGDLGRTAPQLMTFAAAVIALVTAVLPWVARELSPARQRSGIWLALILATVPAATAVTAIGFAAVGGWQLLLIAGVLAELGARRRILLVFGGLTTTTTVAVVLHQLHPIV